MLDRPYQDGRPLDHGDRKKQHDKHAERQRDGDRALTAAFLLRLGEDNSVLLPLVVHCRCHAPPTRSMTQWRGRRPRSATSQTARTDKIWKTQTTAASRATPRDLRAGGTLIANASIAAPRRSEVTP